MSELGSVEDLKFTAEYMSEIQNILGEVLWHSMTVDDTIESVSIEHRDELLRQAKKHLNHLNKWGHLSTKPRLLEVAAYAHVSGYMLAEKNGWQVTLSDCSVETLSLGASHAKQLGLNTDQVRRAGVDFHDLPFESGEFDIVYIASALHHTSRWKCVLKELMRVLSPGGILILQNEPVNRDFCFYAFETNRPGEYRPIEAELDRQGILQTIAQPYPGSRPEALFGMVENQNMPITDILDTIEKNGKVEQLDIDSSICMSSFEKFFLKLPQDETVLFTHIQQELLSRLGEAKKLISDIDVAIGIRLPNIHEVEVFSRKAAKKIISLPDKSSSKYKIALANLFGGAIKVVAKKTESNEVSGSNRAELYFSGTRKDVEIAFPPRLTHVLERTEDLLPDIQASSPSELEEYFSSDEWSFGEDKELGYCFVVLRDLKGKVKLRPHLASGHMVVLFRVWADPSLTPFRVSLYADEQEMSGFDVYQVESFLLNAEIPVNEITPNLSLRINSVGTKKQELDRVPPVTVGAVRVALIIKD